MGKPLKDKAMVWAGAICCLAFLLPNHYSPWLSFHQDAAVALAVLPLLLLGAFRGSPLPALGAGSLLLALVPLLQMATGKLYFAGDGWMAVLYLLGFGLALHAGAGCAARTTAQNEPPLAQFASLWAGLVLAGLFSVAIASHQWLLLGKFLLFIVDLPPKHRPFANLAQPNQLATLLFLGIAGLVFLWECRRLNGFTALSAAALLVFGLVMTGSRTPILVWLWLIPAYFLMRKRCQIRTPPAAVAGVAILFVAFSIGWPALNSFLLLDLDSVSAIDRLSDPGMRTVYWISLADALSRSPWTGYGWGQVGVAQTITALAYPATHSFADSSHNLLLDLALWNGLPVAIAIVGGVLLWFRWQVRQCAEPLAWVTLIAIGVVFTHAMVEYPLSYAYFLLPVGLWMGAVSGMYPSSLDRYLQRGGRWRDIGLPTLGVTVLILAITVVVEYLPYEEDWRLMRFEEARIENQNPTPPSSPPVYLLTQLHEFMRVARLPQTPGMTVQDLEGIRKISERYAYASSMYRYALAQALNNDPLGAQQTLMRLCKMQSVAACLDAQRQWKVDAGRYPQLRTTPWPMNR